MLVLHISPCKFTVVFDLVHNVIFFHRYRAVYCNFTLYDGSVLVKLVVEVCAPGVGMRI